MLQVDGFGWLCFRKMLSGPGFEGGYLTEMQGEGTRTGRGTSLREALETGNVLSEETELWSRQPEEGGQIFWCWEHLGPQTSRPGRLCKWPSAPGQGSPE